MRPRWNGMAFELGVSCSPHSQALPASRRWVNGGERKVALHRRGSREWGEKEGFNGVVPSALDPSFRTSFALRSETTATSLG